jgi:hypothetical protein
MRGWDRVARSDYDPLEWIGVACGATGGTWTSCAGDGASRRIRSLRHSTWRSGSGAASRPPGGCSTAGSCSTRCAPTVRCGRRCAGNCCQGVAGPGARTGAGPRQPGQHPDPLRPAPAYGRGERLLLCTNASPDRDGTVRRFGLHVPAAYDDAVEGRRLDLRPRPPDLRGPGTRHLPRERSHTMTSTYRHLLAGREAGQGLPADADVPLSSGVQRQVTCCCCRRGTTTTTGPRPSRPRA